MSEPVAPASVSDPHRSLNRSVHGVFDNLTRTMNSFPGEGDIIAFATAALASTAKELAALLDSRATDEAAYVARMEAEAKIVADVNDAHEPSQESVALSAQADSFAEIAPAA